MQRIQPNEMRLRRMTQPARGVYGEPPCAPEVERRVLNAWLRPFVGPGRTVLELSAGGGRWTKHLLNARDLYCVDVAGAKLDYLAQRCRHPPHLHLHCPPEDGPELPVLPHDTPIDFVFSSGAFAGMDVPRIVRLLKQLLPMLSPSADVVLEYPIGSALVMEKLLCECGFRVVRHDVSITEHSGIVHARPAHQSAYIWPINTDAAIRLIAWPDPRDPAELMEMFQDYVPALTKMDSACLCVRIDPTVDMDQSAARRVLQATAERSGLSQEVELVVIDEVIMPDRWFSLGRAVTASLCLRSSQEVKRAAFLSALCVPCVRTVDELLLLSS